MYLCFLGQTHENIFKSILHIYPLRPTASPVRTPLLGGTVGYCRFNNEIGTGWFFFSCVCTNVFLILIG
ncbi:MAG: hypothetical protein MUF45_12515 [Spirosomaceae bacterium]|nr:hypothetical protein [Spirosomataceae bacterium]